MTAGEHHTKKAFLHKHALTGFTTHATPTHSSALHFRVCLFTPLSRLTSCSLYTHTHLTPQHWLCAIWGSSSSSLSSNTIPNVTKASAPGLCGLRAIAQKGENGRRGVGRGVGSDTMLTNTSDGCWCGCEQWDLVRTSNESLRVRTQPKRNSGPQYWLLRHQIE